MENSWNAIINCEINLVLTWSENCAIFSATEKTKPEITDAKTYVPAGISWTEDNVKLLKQLESGFKRTIIWSKQQGKLTEQAQNRF